MATAWSHQRGERHPSSPPVGRHLGGTSRSSSTPADSSSPASPPAARGRVPGIVLADTWAALRRAPWNLDAWTVEAAPAPWRDEDGIVATPMAAYAELRHTGPALNLGGHVQDLLIALTCRDHGLPLLTRPRRQATPAAGLAGRDSTVLPPDRDRSLCPRPSGQTNVHARWTRSTTPAIRSIAASQSRWVGWFSR